MSCVRALSVSGVRSFGCGEADRQTMRFERPVTLVLGENGCGKTTLLEALRFALTDELPPGADHGRNFVHDPALDRSREARAQIRLEFTDGNGTRYLVIRTMQAQVKQKKMQFQRLDHCIRTVATNGETVEISGRCGDTNDTIAAVLGVSKAILNNVIFCHQEDSNWPLEEGKKLKERFDAIFDATKYNKCFEHIKKMRKQYAINIKLLEQEVEFCSERKVELDEKKRKLFDIECKITDAKAKLEQLDATLKPVRKRLHEIETIEDHFVEFKSKKEMAKAGLSSCLKTQNELRSIIKSLYNGSEEDLHNEIDSFSTNLKVKEKSLKDANASLDVLMKKDTETNKKISANDRKKSEYITLEGQNQEKLETRNNHILEIANYAGIHDSTTAIDDDDDAVVLSQSIKNKLDSLKRELDESIKNASVEEKKLQKDIDDCRDILTRHKEAISNKRKECKTLDNQANKLKIEIADANTSKSKLEIIKNEMESSERLFLDITKECNVTDSEKSINEQELEINKLESALDQISKNMKILQNQNAKRTEISIQEETLSTKQKTFTRIKNKNKDDMFKLVGNNIPETNFKRTFQDCQNSLKSELESLNKELKEKQHQVASLEVERNHQKKELEKKKKELIQGEEELYKYCKTQNLEDVLIKINSDINKFQDQKSELSSSEFVTKKFVDKLKDVEPCCPLCHRGFESQNDVSDLISELNDKIRNVPKNLEIVTEKLSKLIPEKEHLISLRPLNAKIKQLKNEEISILEKQLDETERNLQNDGDTIEELLAGLAEPENKLSIVENLLSDMPLLDQLTQEMSSLKAELVKLKTQLGDTNIDMTLDEANSKHDHTKQEITDLRKSIKLNQGKLKRHCEKLNAARERKNQVKEEYLKAQAKVQELCSLQKRYDEILEIKVKAESDLNLLTESSLDLQNNLQSSEVAKKKAMENLNKNIVQQRNHVNELDKKYGILLGFNKEIDDHNSKNIPGELTKLKAVLENLTTEREEIALKIKNITSTINQIKDDISNQTLNKRELVDNLTFIKAQKEQQNYENQIKKIDEKIGELNHTALSKEKEKLLRSQNNAMLDKASTEGEIKQLEISVKQTKTELMHSQFKNIVDKYRSKLYELHLLKAMDKDIKDYAFAMDCCLMKYHKDKMKKINTSIRDMWRNIYRGNDIDYIEIKTDESTANTASGNRRVYDYRVVQSRNDVEIDMRGRCSAGQKVLACLIIRMALAENFSHRFGVLALDEPTTNLDRENISSLCCALKEMISTRLRQNNFMFIIITHDAEFLTSLGSVDKISHYYKVTRNQEGKSRIKKERMT